MQLPMCHHGNLAATPHGHVHPILNCSPCLILIFLCQRSNLRLSTARIARLLCAWLPPCRWSLLCWVIEDNYQYKRDVLAKLVHLCQTLGCEYIRTTSPIRHTSPMPHKVCRTNKNRILRTRTTSPDALGLLANLKETCKVQWACQVEAECS